MENYPSPALDGPKLDPHKKNEVISVQRLNVSNPAIDAMKKQSYVSPLVKDNHQWYLIKKYIWCILPLLGLDPQELERQDVPQRTWEKIN